VQIGRALEIEPAGGRSVLAELLVGVLLALVDPFQVADEFRGDPARALPAASRGRTFASRTLA
jgi:hypothetical protein